MNVRANTGLSELSTDVLSQLNALDEAIDSLVLEGRENSGDLSRLAQQLAELAAVFDMAMARRAPLAVNDDRAERAEIA